MSNQISKINICVCVMSLMFGFMTTTRVFCWIEGRLNTSITCLLWLLMAHALWASGVLFLIVRGLWELWHWSRKAVRGHLANAAMVGLALIPILAFGASNPQYRFEQGLRAWTTSNIEVDRIREWHDTQITQINVTAQEPLPSYWPSAPYVENLGVRIDRSHLPDFISRLSPRDVWLLTTYQGVVFEWWGTWFHLVYIATSEDQRLPDAWKVHYIDWTDMGAGVYLGVRIHH